MPRPTPFARPVADPVPARARQRPSVARPLVALGAGLAAALLAPAAVAQQTYLKAANADAGDLFGTSVALSGDTLVVSAMNEDSSAIGVDGDADDDGATNSGAVYVFERGAGGWTQTAYLKPTNTGGGDKFGICVDLDGDTLVVGAYLEQSANAGVGADGSDDSLQAVGAAYVFVRNGSTWAQQAYLKPANPSAKDRFGISVAVDGDTVLVGASHESSDGTDPFDDSMDSAGAAYVFVRNGSTWSQEAMLKAHEPGADDRFGIAVDVNGDTAIVGGYYEDSAATGVDGDATDDSSIDAGAAYVFERSGTSWTQTAYLKAANTDPDDNFGFPVRVEDDTIVVGARSEDGGTMGVDGDDSDDSAPNAGAVYVFERSGSSWVQSAYLKSFDVDAEDRFGYAIDLSGDSLVVGAHWEASTFGAANPDASDDSASQAGAAYVFARTGGTWVQRHYAKAGHPSAGDLLGRTIAIDGDRIAMGARAEDGSATGDGSDDLLDGSGSAEVIDLGYWDELAGCHGNAAAFGRPSGALRVGTTTRLRIESPTVPSGIVATFRGVAGVDASGCGVLLAPGEEALLAASPTPVLIGIAPLAGGAAEQPLGVPAAPAFVGLRVAVQAVAVDPVTFAAAFTNGLDFEIQP